MIRLRPLAAVVALGAIVLVALLLVRAPAPQASAQDVDRVIVTNFPEVQRVAGSVRVGEPIPQSELVRRLEVIVPPVDRAATTQLVEVPSVEADGFTHAVLALRGEVQGNLTRGGTTGALLVPNEEPIVRAFQEEGLVEFPLEVQAAVVPADRGYFASDQPRYALGFPRYRVFFYNSSDRPVEVDLYVYLTN